MASRVRDLAGTALVVVVLVACGGGDDDGGSGVDGGGGGPDAAGGDCAATPEVTPAWLPDLTDDVVARLSGERPVTGGLTLADRATAGRRDAARGFLAEQLGGLGLEVQLDDYGSGTNLYAEIAPSDGEAAASSWLVLGAHFDSVPGSPGANDNATGVAMVVAAARFAAELSCRRQGVIVALFDEEEIGLVGSANFAALLEGSGLAIDSVHTIDQMGWDMDGDRAIELELPGAGLAARYQAAAAAFDLAVPRVETDTTSTDHQSFRDVGFAAIGLTEEYVSGDTTPHYHEPTDTYDTVDFGYLTSTAALVHAVVAGFVRQDASAAVGQPSALAALAAARAGRLPIAPVPGGRARAHRPR